MLGLEGYGSGSESDSSSEKQQPTKSPSTTVSTATKPSAKLPPPSSNGPSSSKISLPPPKTTKRAPKKITIGLPALPKDENEEKDDIELERPAAKRQRTGAGASSLLSMLPAPKQKAPVALQSERVLGGGKGPGLVFTTRPTTAPAPSNAVAGGEDEGEADEGDEEQAKPTIAESATSTTSSASSLPFLPPSLAKGRANISLEDKPKASSKPPLPKVSAAPAVDSSPLGM